MRSTLAITLALAAVSSLGAQATVGTVTTSGEGCVKRANMIFELFPVGSFDLDGTSISFVPAGNTYNTLPNSGVTALPFGAANGSIDTLPGGSGVVGPFSYGFNFPLVTGGTSTAVDVGANGFVMLISGTGGASRSSNSTSSSALEPFASEGPSFELLGMNLRPDNGGTVWWNPASATTPAYATWDTVPESGQANSQNCQIQFAPSGVVHLVFFGVNPVNDMVLTGYSAGNGTPLGESQDLGARPILGTGAPAQLGLALDSVSVPTIGETTVFDLTHVPASAVSGGLVLGTGAQPTPIDLAYIGLDGGCSLQTLADIPAALPITLSGPGAGTASLPIPPNANFVGLALTTQAFLIAPGENAGGGILSNEATITIGDFRFTPPGISVLVHGDNSHNDDTTAGFFSVRHNDPARAPIASVRFDFFAGPSTREFDTDQRHTNIPNHRFDGGQPGALGNCLHNYRNNCDLATGLVYAGTAASACDPAVLTGWVGSNQLGTSPDYLTMDFAFTNFVNGTTFEFDCDTDGGGSTSGSAGGAVGIDLIMTITLTDSTVLSGVPVLLNATTAQLIF